MKQMPAQKIMMAYCLLSLALPVHAMQNRASYVPTLSMFSCLTNNVKKEYLIAGSFFALASFAYLLYWANQVKKSGGCSVAVPYASQTSQRSVIKNNKGNPINFFLGFYVTDAQVQDRLMGMTSMLRASAERLGCSVAYTPCANQYHMTVRHIGALSGQQHQAIKETSAQGFLPGENSVDIALDYISAWTRKNSKGDATTHIVLQGPLTESLKRLRNSIDQKIDSVVTNSRQAQSLVPHILLLTVKGDCSKALEEEINAYKIKPVNFTYEKIQLGGGKSPYPAFAIQQK